VHSLDTRKKKGLGLGVLVLHSAQKKKKIGKRPEPLATIATDVKGGGTNALWRKLRKKKKRETDDLHTSQGGIKERKDKKPKMWDYQKEKRKPKPTQKDWNRIFYLGKEGGNEKKIILSDGSGEVCPLWTNKEKQNLSRHPYLRSKGGGCGEKEVNTQRDNPAGRLSEKSRRGRKSRSSKGTTAGNTWKSHTSERKKKRGRGPASKVDRGGVAQTLGSGKKNAKKRKPNDSE